MSVRQNSSEKIEINLVRLYWIIRFGIAFIWIWTAIVSWFVYPQVESLHWLHRLGLKNQTYFLFAGACFIDLMAGIASALFASRKIWKWQFVIVVFYSVAIAIKIPEFLMHPFGPITKNITVLACIAYLILMEKS